MWASNIRSRVLAQVDERIASGQAEYNECALTEDKKLVEAVSALTEVCRTNKQKHEDRIVGKIIG